MIIADDLNTDDGLMLLPRGFELSPAALAHIVDRFRDRLPERVKIRAGDASHQH